MFPLRQLGRRGFPFRRRRRQPPGLSPGTIIVDPDAPAPVISVIAYGPTELAEWTVPDVEELREIAPTWNIVWINIDGLGDERVLSRVAEIFELHRLVIEDVVNVHQRVKVEDYDEDQFIVGRMPVASKRFGTEQISIFMQENRVITFQERPGDCFDQIRKRIRTGKGNIRQSGADYLAYAIVDALVDSFFPIVDNYGDRLQEIEDEILDDPDKHTISKIHDIKRDLVQLRRIVLPYRDALNMLIRDRTQRIREETLVYFRDCFDHAIQLIDEVNNHREFASSLMDLYLSITSNRMNDVMRVLTVIATIFIPLTFVAGVFGMNFDPDSSPWNMPELRWYWGYPVCLALMLLVALALLAYFRRKSWL